MIERIKQLVIVGKNRVCTYRDIISSAFISRKHSLALYLGLSIMLTGLISCGDNYNECTYDPDISDVKINIEIEQLEDSFTNVSSREELSDLLKQYPIIREYFMKRSTYPNDSIMLDVLMKKFQNPHIDSLSMEVKRVFGDLSGLKTDLSQAFSHLKYYYPEVSIPKIQTVVSGLAHDIYFSDSLIVIGLDYYLGTNAKYRPLNLYQYMLQRYSPEYIAPSIMLLYGISGDFNNTNLKDKTALADMVAYGKSFYFAKRMMPCVPDSVLIWYSDEEITGVRENKKIIWQHIVDKELLYETNHMTKKKYLDERPKTYEIGEKAPGRIATWVGWDIVREYMDKNSEVTLSELMTNSDAQKLFQDSKYKP